MKGLAARCRRSSQARRRIQVSRRREREVRVADGGGLRDRVLQAEQKRRWRGSRREGSGHAQEEGGQAGQGQGKGKGQGRGSASARRERGRTAGPNGLVVLLSLSPCPPPPYCQLLGLRASRPCGGPSPPKACAGFAIVRALLGSRWCQVLLPQMQPVLE
eukprot:9475058-Pyramimonas_sp.AAC.1